MLHSVPPPALPGSSPLLPDFPALPDSSPLPSLLLPGFPALPGSSPLPSLLPPDFPAPPLRTGCSRFPGLHAQIFDNAVRHFLRRFQFF